MLVAAIDRPEFMADRTCETIQAQYNQQIVYYDGDRGGADLGTADDGW